MTTTTTRFGILRPVTTDPAAGAPTTGLTKYITSPTDRLEAIGAQYLQGTLASRPSASIAGRFYVATDASTLYYDTGSAWILFATTPMRYSNAGPATLLAGSWGVLATTLHLGVAGTWRFILSADFISTGTDSGRIMGLDIDVYTGSTHHRSPGTGDQLQVKSLGTTAFLSASKQMFVTTPGSSDVDLYGYVQTSGGQASNLKLFGELVA